MWRAAVMLVGVMGSALHGVAQQQPIGRGVNFYSLEKEMALGRILASEIEREYTVVRDPEISEYINRVGQALAARPQAAPYTYTFTLVRGGDTHEWVEPAALPGGIIFLAARSIGASENEAQLAGMLAHAISHIAARHGTRAATRGQIASLDTVPLVFAGWWMPGRGKHVPLGFLAFARAFEREADWQAVSLMAETGYNPAELIPVFERLPHDPTSPMGAAFATHPRPEDRIKSVQAAIQSLPERTYGTGAGQFERIKELVAKLPPD